mgnify:FL=1
MIEILQTIWSSLTTENPVLTNYICVPLAFIEVFISMLIFTTLLNIKGTKKQKWLYVLVVSCFSAISLLFIPSPYNAYLNLIVVFLTVLLTFKTTILKSVICLFLPSIIAALIESILAKVYYCIFNIDYLVGGNIPLHRLIGTLIVYIIMFLIYILLKYFKINLSKLQVLDKKKKFWLTFSTLFGVLLIGLQVYMITFYVSYLPFFITIIFMVTLVAYFIISLYTMFTVSKLETTSMNLEEATLYNKTLQMLQDNTRAFRHDFSNIVQGMAGFIDKNDMEGLKKYYSQLLEDIQHTNNLTTLSPEVVNNPAIYNVLATKYHKADQLGIKINLEAFLNMNDLHIKIYEFTRVLGILMDNAIEAAKECDEKIINVVFRKDSKRHMQLLIVENTYTNKDVNTDKIFEKGYSTKQGNTGLGLWEVRQILKKNNNLNLFTTKNDEFFTQQFEIFY